MIGLYARKGRLILSILAAVFIAGCARGYENVTLLGWDAKGKSDGGGAAFQSGRITCFVYENGVGDIDDVEGLVSDESNFKSVIVVYDQDKKYVYYDLFVSNQYQGFGFSSMYKTKSENVLVNISCKDNSAVKIEKLDFIGPFYKALKIKNFNWVR